MSVENDRVSVLVGGGFGTRLLDLGITTPKGLFKFQVEGKSVPIIEHTVNLLINVSDHVYVVTNGRFDYQYREWLENYPLKNKLDLISNGITVPEQRLGAIGDLNFAVKRFGVNSDMIVAPSDTVIEGTLREFVSFCRNEREILAVMFEKKSSTKEIANRLGCGVIENGVVTAFVEKPENPPSLNAVVPFYYYPKEIIPLIGEYLAEGNNPDAPSNIIPWFLKKGISVRGYINKNKTQDIGTPADVERLQKDK